MQVVHAKRVAFPEEPQEPPNRLPSLGIVGGSAVPIPPVTARSRVPLVPADRSSVTLRLPSLPSEPKRREEEEKLTSPSSEAAERVRAYYDNMKRRIAAKIDAI